MWQNLPAEPSLQVPGRQAPSLSILLSHVPKPHRHPGREGRGPSRLGDKLSNGHMGHGGQGPSPHPPLTPVGAEPGAETRKALDAISQRLSRVPRQLSVRRAWSSGCFVCLCVGCRGRVGCDGVKEAKELNFHLLHGRRV